MISVEAVTAINQKARAKSPAAAIEQKRANDAAMGGFRAKHRAKKLADALTKATKLRNTVAKIRGEVGRALEIKRPMRANDVQTMHQWLTHRETSAAAIEKALTDLT
jgi:hypothetical protein